jgi:hypothetical protein
MNSEPSSYSQVFNHRIFIKTFGLQEAITAFLLALLMLYTIRIRDNFSIEFLPFIHEAIIILPLILNHVLYRLKHKTSNNFIGRVIHDYITITLFVIILYIYSNFINTDYSISLAKLFNIWLIAFFWIIGLEILVALLKRSLAFIGLRIL